MRIVNAVLALCIVLSLAGCGLPRFSTKPGFDADALAVEAQNSFAHGHVQHGIDLLRICLRYNRGTDRQAAAAQNLNDLAVMLIASKDYAGAKRYLEEALESYKFLKDKKGELTARLNIISISLRQGDRQTLLPELEQLKKEAQQAGLGSVEASTRNEIAHAYVEQGKFDDARREFENAMGLYRRESFKPGEATCLHNLADVEIRLGKTGEAKRHLEEAIKIDKEKELWPSLGDDLYLMAHALEAEGNKEAARNFYERSFYVYRYTSNPAQMDVVRKALTNLGGATLDADEAPSAVPSSPAP